MNYQLQIPSESVIVSEPLDLSSLIGKTFMIMGLLVIAKGPSQDLLCSSWEEQEEEEEEGETLVIWSSLATMTFNCRVSNV